MFVPLVKTNLRPESGLDLMRREYAGIDVGGTGTKIGLFDEQARLLGKENFQQWGKAGTVRGCAGLHGHARRRAPEAVAGLDLPSILAEAGMGVPGQVDTEEQL